MNATTTTTANLQDQVLNLFTDNLDQLQERITRSEQQESKLRDMLDKQRDETAMLKGIQQDKIAAKSQGIAALQQAIKAFQWADKIDPSGKMGDELLSTLANIRTAIADNDILPELPAVDPETTVEAETTPIEPEPETTVDVEPAPIEPETISDHTSQVKQANGGIKNPFEPEHQEETISDRVSQVKQANGGIKNPSQTASTREVMDAIKFLHYRQIKWLAKRQKIKSGGKTSDIIKRIEDALVAGQATYTQSDLTEAQLR
jgi:hypothetical protein